MSKNVVSIGSSVVECALMFDYELEWAEGYGTSWYRSKDRKGGVHLFVSFMLNKKWTLEEELNHHMFQQVTVSSNYFYKLQAFGHSRLD